MSPTLQELYSIEEAFETEFLRLLKDVCAPGRYAYLEFSDKQKVPPFVEIRLTDLKPKDNQMLPLPDGNYAFPIWEGKLICRIVTERGVNSDQQNAFIGWIRSVTVKIILGGMQLPNHVVSYVAPDVAPRAHDPELGLDITEQHFAVVIEMKDGVFGV